MATPVGIKHQAATGLYQVALAVVILIAYPQDAKIDLSRESASAQRLVDFFFVGQFAIASLMAPSFTSGAITGEKERKTYEMLLASPLRPAVIVAGKLIAAAFARGPCICLVKCA